MSFVVFFRFKSLKLKILLPVLCITFLGFLTVTVSVYLIATRIISGDVEQMSENAADKLSTAVDGSIKTWMSQIEILASTNAVKEMDFEKYRQYVEDRKEFFQGYEAFFMIDTSGNYKATLGSDGNVSERNYFKNAMKGITSVSTPLASKATGKLVVVIASPIKDANGSICGAAAASIELTSLNQIINSKKLGQTGYAFMVGKDGAVLAHPDKEMLNQNLLKNENPGLVEIVKKMIAGETYTGYYDFNGIRKVASCVPVKSCGWSVAMTTDYKEVTKGIDSLRNSSLAIGFAAIILILVITSLLVSNSIKPILKMAEATRQVAAGNLRVRIDAKSNDEIGILAGNFNDMTEKMRGLLTETRDMGIAVASSSQQMVASSEEVSKGSEQVAAAVSELAKGASEQAVSTEKSSARIGEIVEGLGRIADDMNDSKVLADQAMGAVDKGEKSVQLQEAKMNESKLVALNVEKTVSALSQKSSEIGQIVEVIRSIAEQTNLLSLNAAIEAARAGEQGKGFAVVADEVRRLAEQSKLSVTKIGELIKEVQAGVGQTVTETYKSRDVSSEQEKALNQTVKAFSDISGVVASISNNIKTVSEVTNTVSKNARQVGEAIRSIANIAEDFAAGTEEVAASTQEQTAVLEQISQSSAELARIAGRLQEGIEIFTV